jgi:hypothetical protein
MQVMIDLTPREWATLLEYRKWCKLDQISNAEPMSEWRKVEDTIHCLIMLAGQDEATPLEVEQWLPPSSRP